MAVIDRKTRKLFKSVLKHGYEYNNKRRSVKRLQISDYTIRQKSEQGFPALSLKKLKFNDVTTELLWFLRGDNDIEFLRKHNVNIWNKDAYNWHVREREFKGIKPMTFKQFVALGKGSVGANYSVQWRNFNHQGIDQIQNLLDGMRADIMSTRLIVEAWNPAQLDQTALPPCHKGFQIIGQPIKGSNDFGFKLKWTQRSTDLFLGYPFNIASYFELGSILGEMTGYKFLGVIGSLTAVHFYDNQYKEAQEFCNKQWDKYANCELKINYPLKGRNADVFNELEPHHFELIGYESDGYVPVKMIAPKKI